MNHPDNAVSIHPYFKIHSGKVEAAKALLPTFIERTSTEPKNLYYGFSLNGDELFCREAYVDAEALLAHIENVGEQLRQMLAIADVKRIEVHGPPAELDKLRGPLGDLKPVYFSWFGGIAK